MNPECKLALDQASAKSTTVKSRKLLMTYLQECTALNGLEVSSIIQVVSEVSLHTSADAPPLLQAFMGAWVRLGLKDRFPQQTMALHPCFDEVFCFFYAKYRKKQYSEIDIWEMTKKAAPLVFETPSDVEQLLQHTGSWLTMSSLLNKVTKESKFAQLLFGFALEEAAVEWVDDALDTEYGSLDGVLNKDLTDSHFDNIKKRILAQIDTHGFEFLLTMQRTVHVEYRTLEFNKVFTSMTEIFAERKRAFLKTRGVGKGIPELSFEKNLFPVRHGDATEVWCPSPPWHGCVALSRTP
jgi:hypothetical protein